MRVRLEFFGRFSDVQQGRDADLPVEVSTVDALSRWLGQEDEDFAALLERTGNSIVRNGIICRGDEAISEGDEIAFLSPLSGG